MLKILLVDDERLAIVEMRRLLSNISDIEVVGEASNGEEALVLIESTSPDLVLLDIRMPEMTGLELAEKALKNVHFVFCTAYSEHALEAFGLNAAGYLMKPIDKERLIALVGKIKLMVAESSPQGEETPYLSETHGLLLKSSQSYQIIKIGDIDRIESIGNHVAIYALGKKHFLHVSLSKVEQKLNPSDFVKASRSDILRISSITSLEDGMSTGTLIAHLNTGDDVEISRRQAHNLRKSLSLDVNPS
ncbi:response regulator transcription factor [Pseudidiomarina sp. 1APP75-27a]|uniref:LytR/AlgR family response regulator transcription factor n=1 Tax=Pseudidiomarina terrestris TaxID=2820060 RepID=UPI002B0584DA|nr:response regulator transcription factor [Pseudidiomarina sp. 1APP75-27a]MEA3588429.1 response regulator transcription factor [Pseudidiomarina sp. 1APP75-27a]